MVTGSSTFEDFAGIKALDFVEALPAEAFVDDWRLDDLGLTRLWFFVTSEPCEGLPALFVCTNNISTFGVRAKNSSVWVNRAWEPVIWMVEPPSEDGKSWRSSFRNKALHARKKNDVWPTCRLVVKKRVPASAYVTCWYPTSYSLQAKNRFEQPTSRSERISANQKLRKLVGNQEKASQRMFFAVHGCSWVRRSYNHV